MLIAPRSKVLFIGDSITDAGRARPHGEGLFGALGTGFVALADALIQSTYPGHGIRVVNRGNSGNTVRDLADRWREDALDPEPDWLVVMIGINDVWRKFDSPERDEHVPIEEYESTLRALLSQVKSRLVLLTPFVVERATDDEMRATMDAYGAVVKKLAHEFDAIFVDTQAAFDAALIYRHPTYYAWDRIHPTMPGCMILTRAFLNGVGYDWSGT